MGPFGRASHVGYIMLTHSCLTKSDSASKLVDWSLVLVQGSLPVVLYKKPGTNPIFTNSGLPYSPCPLFPFGFKSNRTSNPQTTNPNHHSLKSEIYSSSGSCVVYQKMLSDVGSRLVYQGRTVLKLLFMFGRPPSLDTPDGNNIPK